MKINFAFKSHGSVIGADFTRLNRSQILPFLQLLNACKSQTLSKQPWNDVTCLLENGLWRSSVDVDAFATTYSNQGLTFDLWPPEYNQVISKQKVKRQRLPILVTERWAWSWSRCTGSHPAGDLKSPTGGTLPLLSARPAVTFPAAEYHRF